MSEPFLSEIKIVSFNWAPKGWAICNGQFLPINQNQALFSLLGTTYGGNGQTTFALPDFRGRAPIHVGAGHTLGETGGAASVTVNLQTMPQHFHFMSASNAPGNENAPAVNPPPVAKANVWAQSSQNPYSSADAPIVSLNAGSITNTGGSQPHENRQPYLVLNFIIALQGIFPSPN